MKTVLVDYRIDDVEKDNLEKLGFKVLTVPPSAVLYEPVCGHPDMLLNMIHKNTIMVHSDMQIDFIDKLKNFNTDIIISQTSIQKNYPYNVILNAVNLDNLFMHNIKCTDAELLSLVRNKKIKDVKQGYTKCSTAVVSSTAIMTSDKGIARSAQEEGLDVLLLPPGDIALPGLDYGFIGGCCGLLEDGLLSFYGNLNYYTYGKEVMNFLKKHNVEAAFLRQGKLIDRGSIFTL